MKYRTKRRGYPIRSKFFVTIGYRHECFHPVIPNSKVLDIELNWEGYLNEVFIRFEKEL